MENFQNSGGGGKGLYIGLGILAVVLIIVGGLMYYYWDNIKAWWSGEDEEKAKADKAKADKAKADKAAADRVAQTRPIRVDGPTTVHSMSPEPAVNIGGTTTSPSVPAITASPVGASTTIDVVQGWSGGAHINPPGMNQTPEDCRRLAIAGGHPAWGHRTVNHQTPEMRNTCYLYTQGFQPFSGNPGDPEHITGCPQPGQRVANGCR